MYGDRFNAPDGIHVQLHAKMKKALVHNNEVGIGKHGLNLAPLVRLDPLPWKMADAAGNAEQISAKFAIIV